MTQRLVALFYGGTAVSIFVVVWANALMNYGWPRLALAWVMSMWAFGAMAKAWSAWSDSWSDAEDKKGEGDE